jgi:hypothetical protein
MFDYSDYVFLEQQKILGSSAQENTGVFQYQPQVERILMSAIVLIHDPKDTRGQRSTGE